MKWTVISGLSVVMLVGVSRPVVVADGAGSRDGYRR
jgi:hypothetical protein